MALQLLPETEISSNGDGSIVYTGEWSECLTILKGFKVTQAEGAYSFVAFVPTATLSAAPTPYTSSTTTETSTNWSADETALANAGKLISTGAQLRALPGGRGQLTIKLSAPTKLREQILEAILATTGAKGTEGERSYSFGVSEIPSSILDAQTPDVKLHLTGWLSAPALTKAMFHYPTGWFSQTAELTAGEKALAIRIATSGDTIYTYLPNVTLTISNMAAAPEGLPTIGGTTGPSGDGFAINLPSGSYTWRIINSGSWQNPNGTWSGTVQWISEPVIED